MVNARARARSASLGALAAIATVALASIGMGCRDARRTSADQAQSAAVTITAGDAAPLPGTVEPRPGTAGRNGYGAPCTGACADRSNAEPRVPPDDCETLVRRVCAEPDVEQATCTLAQKQGQRLGRERCSAMLRHYEQALAGLRRLQEARRLLAMPRRSAHGDLPALGPSDAKVTVVLFSDFECAECARASPVATTLKNLYGTTVRFVFRQFPWSTHAHAHLAAEASLAAQAQGKFWEYHDVLFSNQHALERADLERYAAVAGLDVSAFKKALAARTFVGDVDEDRELGRKLAIDELPAMFVNGQRVSVPYGVAELARVIDEALAER